MDTDPDSPRPTGKPTESVTLTGTCMPWKDDHPVFLTMPGSPWLYLPLFENAAALEAVLGHYGVTYASVKRVDDEREFIESITDPGVVVILNPRLTETGRLRFLQVL